LSFRPEGEIFLSFKGSLHAFRSPDGAQRNPGAFGVRVYAWKIRAFVSFVVR